MSYSFDGGGDYVPNQSQFTTDSSNSYYYEHASQTVQVKQDPDFHMFGSNGLLDMLATVATQTLNNDVSLRDVKTRPMSPQFEVKPNVSGNTSAILSSKTTSTRNPRSLTDYDVFTFQQVNILQQTHDPRARRYLKLSNFSWTINSMYISYLSKLLYIDTYLTI
jgi:hypothetical protein